ncbi:MAG: alkaline phosphatase [Planctomycetota bacterium]|nr:alkaline phosphatase [Planctomycetota bacterium]
MNLILQTVNAARNYVLDGRATWASVFCLGGLFCGSAAPAQPISEMQREAAESRMASWAHWGPETDRYSSWGTHSNRLVPIYTFGGNLKSVSGNNSVYRDQEKVQELYGTVPMNTVNPRAQYLDQTDVHKLQLAAIEAGKKKVILMVFDGMDYQTTRAAAIYKTKKVAYDSGRGTGLRFQDYNDTETDFGSFVSSPHNDGTKVNVNKQQVTNPGGATPGGYDPQLGGRSLWEPEANVDPRYLIGKNEEVKQAYTDSAASATSMTSGIKTYNNAINVDFSGREVLPLGRLLQERGFAVGAVTSVPISHATPACTYANNVHRSDYQDITRDMLGLPSVFHPGGLPGLDVVIGCGWGEERAKDGSQGENFLPGNRYLTEEDLNAIRSQEKDPYRVVLRTPGKSGKKTLAKAAAWAARDKERLFGLFGVKGGHLPFRTADGNFEPVISVGNPKPLAAETYSPADLNENPELFHMAEAALKVLDARGDKWWLMIEAGDVDWANHANNIDNSIGAVLSGEKAFNSLVKWIETHGGWEDYYVIVTADHGHYLVLDEPEAIAGAK